MAGMVQPPWPRACRPPECPVGPCHVRGGGGGSDTGVIHNTTHGGCLQHVPMGLHVDTIGNAWSHARRGDVRAWRTSAGGVVCERGGGRAWRRTSVVQRTSVRAYERTSVRACDPATLRAMRPCGLATLQPCDPASERANQRANEPASQRGERDSWRRACVGVAAYERGRVRAWRRTGRVAAYEPASVRAFERASVRAYERASMEEGMCGGVRVCVLRRTTVASVRAWRRTSVLQRTSLRAYEPPSERVHDRAALRPCDPARGGVRVCVCGGGRACEPTSPRAYEPTSL